jgi:hypothetical protein
MQSNLLMTLAILIVASLLGLSSEYENAIDEKPAWCKDLSKSKQTCNPPEPPNSPFGWLEYCTLWKEMDRATYIAHHVEVRFLHSFPSFISGC